MNDYDGGAKPRIRVVDMSNDSFKPHGRKRRRGRNHNQNGSTNVSSGNLDDALTKQWPLESMSIQRAVVEYGKRTASLGVLFGAHALRKMIDRIIALGPPGHELSQIIADGELEISKIRSSVDHNIYEDD